uniref:ribosomal protein S9 n=1 Tax=Cephaleuros parasiticus TaxID=173370 RepID=UPI001EDE46AB|nr:ribosomal protein S9 [Cephaleuros parasiticus]UIB39033.1 ribosomal protein S9 [Cephaleuros parasiticus]
MQKVGRRKSSIASVKAVLGTGKIFINKKSDNFYFQNQSLLLGIIHSPLKKIQAENNYDFHITVRGGGIFSQAYAIRLGIVRTLTHLSDVNVTNNKINHSDKNTRLRSSFLSSENARHNSYFLTRDPRVKERRKYGLKKARKASQFSKR